MVAPPQRTVDLPEVPGHVRPILGDGGLGREVGGKVQQEPATLNRDKNINIEAQKNG